MPGDQAPKDTGMTAGQAVVFGRYNWDVLIKPLLDVLDVIESGVNFHSTPGFPEVFMEIAKRVVGDKANLFADIFLNITSKTDEIAKQSIAVYRPFVYDTRDIYFPKVLGLKMSEEHPSSRLTEIVLGVDLKQSKVVLAIQNAKLKDKKDNPSLVFIAGGEGREDIDILQNPNEVSAEGQWLDEEFGGYVDDINLAVMGHALAFHSS